MTPDLPDPSAVWKAIDTYLSLAYDDVTAPPTTIRSLLSTLRAWVGPFYDAPVFAHTGAAEAQRHSLRLGNRNYPHMKLVLEVSPDGSKYLFKADTHDRHVCPPPGTPEHDAFKQLMLSNQAISERIEAAWAEIPLPTFKTFLREDLARRQAAATK